MPSITEAKTNLPELAERLRAVASALRHLSTDHPCFSEDMKALREETQAIVARLRRPDQSEQGDSPAYSRTARGKLAS